MQPPSISISDFFSLSFYFSQASLGHDFPNKDLLMLTSFILIGLGIVWIIIRKLMVKKNKTKKLTKKYAGTLIWFGVIGLLLVWFRTEELPYLDLRIWWVLYYIIFIIIVIRQIINFKREYSVKVKKIFRSEYSKDKYLEELQKRKKKKRK